MFLRLRYSTLRFIIPFLSRRIFTRFPIISTGGIGFGDTDFTGLRTVMSRFAIARLRGLTREQTNIITLHLGNGCSAAAIKNGVSVDTSMGMTPLEGLVMGTRSGDLDPGDRRRHCTQGSDARPSEVDTLLNTQSGLLGISGLTNDMRELQAELKEHDDRRGATRDRDLLLPGAEIYWSLPGCDGRCRCDRIYRRHWRELARRSSAHLRRTWSGPGFVMMRAKNQETVGREGIISTDDSKMLAYAIPTDEEVLIARDTVRVIKGEPHPS